MGFRLFGPKWPIPLADLGDLDILVDRTGARFLPLLRLLESVREEVDVLAEDDQGPVRFSFFPKGKRKAIVSIPDRTIQVGLEIREAEFIRKRSEFTRAWEIYVPEPLFAEAMGYRLEWSQANLEYRATADAFPDWYLAEKKAKAFDWQSVKETPENIPEILPPAKPRENGLDFLEVSLSGGYQAYDDGKETSGGADRPRERVWGRAAGGNFRTDLSQRGFSWPHDDNDDKAFFVDRAWWNRETGRSAWTLGDAELGLGELVFPSAPLSGARLAWGGSESGRRAFAPEITVEDVAPMDSQVDLYVNSRLIESTRVRDPLKDMPGFGFFRFDGVTLVPGRDNEIRLLITEPSGVKKEIVRTVLGTQRVLQPGDASGLLGVGTYRSKSEWENHGFFSGGVFRLGLWRGFTGEISGGYQSNFQTTVSTDGEDDATAPKESAHLGASLTWQPYDRGYVKGDFAVSDDVEKDQRDLAARVFGTLRMGSLEIRPDIFRYGPDYYDGYTADLRDREGGWLGASFPFTQGVTARGGVGWVRNNLDSEEEETLEETLERVEIATAGWISQTRLSGAVDFAQPRKGEGENGVLYSVVAESSLTRTLEAEGRVYLGDNLYSDEHGTLTDNLRLLELPFYTQPYNGGRLRWQAAPGLSFSAAHWNYRTRKQSLLGIAASGAQGFRWDLQSELGMDWEEGEEEGGSALDGAFWRARLGLYLDRRGNRRLSLQGGWQDEQWSALAAFNVNEVFGFDGFEPVWLTGRDISAASGCVVGRVFLDRNGDGRRQGDEQGLPRVAVTMPPWRAETDESGRFILRPSFRKEKGRVSLDLKKLDAIYTPTNGTQLVAVANGSISFVELGVAVFGTVTGTVQVLKDDGGFDPVVGATVALYDADGKQIAKSVTARDGSYYLGEVKPGVYWVRVEEKSLPARHMPRTPPQRVAMESGDEEPVTRSVDFVVVPERAEGKPASAEDVARWGVEPDRPALGGQAGE